MLQVKWHHVTSIFANFTCLQDPVGSQQFPPAEKKLNRVTSADWHGALGGDLAKLPRLGRERCSTLWLCQNSYWKWSFIADLPIENGDVPYSYVNVYQRVTQKINRKMWPRWSDDVSSIIPSFPTVLSCSIYLIFFGGVLLANISNTPSISAAKASGPQRFSHLRG